MGGEQDRQQSRAIGECECGHISHGTLGCLTRDCPCGVFRPVERLERSEEPESASAPKTPSVAGVCMWCGCMNEHHDDNGDCTLGCSPGCRQELMDADVIMESSQAAQSPLSEFVSCGNCSWSGRPGQAHACAGALPRLHQQPHYTELPIEPVDVIEAWELPYHLGTVVAYIARHKRKGGLEDLEKALQHLHRAVRGRWLE